MEQIVNQESEFCFLELHNKYYHYKLNTDNILEIVHYSQSSNKLLEVSLAENE